jgi:predicted ATP-dependent endonuclease of OLD family
MFFAKFVLLLEGEGEELIIPKILDEIAQEKKEDIMQELLVVNLRGDTKHPLFRKALDELEIPYLVVLDQGTKRTELSKCKECKQKVKVKITQLRKVGMQSEKENERVFCYEGADLDDTYSGEALTTEAKKVDLAIQILEMKEKKGGKIKQYFKPLAWKSFEALFDKLKEEVQKQHNQTKVSEQEV